MKDVIKLQKLKHSNLVQTKAKMNLLDFQKQLNYTFKDKNLLLEAITHRSCAKKINNERLEFLGDAVLDLVVGEFLFSKFPKHNEGKLSKMRSSLVNEESFAKIAKTLRIGEILVLSKSEEQNNGRNKNSLLSNALEAIMGAIYLESGIEKVKEIMNRLLNDAYPNMEINQIFTDYKTALQELTQAKFGEIPRYEIIDERGPDHNKEFYMQIVINHNVYAKAKGKSKKSAQQSCAKIAYEKIRQNKHKNFKDT